MQWIQLEVTPFGDKHNIKNTIRYLQHYPLTITITRRIRHNSDDSEDGALSSIDHNSVPIVEVEELLPPGEVEK